ncbi:MAG: hypothetical protein U0L84_01455 [Acutalibacteraceae bacterium]|nr:hypothetical protein [Clostridia bacterium]MEE0808006.1 hypothetical protein [Acutalibacteraceae bacterium]
MLKVDKTVLKETKYIAAVTVILSVLLQAVFLIIHKWNYTVLLGNVLGAAAATGNFFLMGLTVQRAVRLDEKEAKTLMKSSQTLRNFGLFVIGMIGVLISVFNTVTVLVPLFFPRFAILLKPFVDKSYKE